MVVGSGLYLVISQSPVELAPISSPRVVAKYPHDSTAFTQGLLIEEGKLYEGTGQYGESSLRRVDLLTGQVEQERALGKSFFGEGLAALGDRLYQLTWKEGSCFVYDLQSLVALDTLAIPTREGWGLTEDGENLILSDGSDRLRYLDPQTLKVIREIKVRDGDRPVSRLNELEYINGLIYANVWQNAHIAIIDPQTGRVVHWLNLNWLNIVHSPIDGADVLNGIAYDSSSGRIYVTGKLWPTLYAFNLPSLAHE